MLKRHIIRHFDKEDVRTYGLSFAMQTRLSSCMFGSVIIRKQQNKNPHKLKSLDRFDILYNRNFSPNSGELVVFREGVEKDYLGTYLVSLCKLFYEQESKDDVLYHHVNTATAQNITATKTIKQVHQCKHCFTVYDETETNTAFETLPKGYSCSLCDAPKKDFIEVDESLLQLQD